MAMTDTSKVLAATIEEIAQEPFLARGIEAVRVRASEFGGDNEMLLSGIAMVPEARALLDDRLDEAWRTGTIVRPEAAGEVVIGAGLHAAVYCAARVRMGFPKPLVLERGRVGGVFAMSRRLSFFLNSRNRPGPLGLPSEGRGLNYLPGAAIQPANLSGLEFQTNADLAWVIRVALAQFARVMTAAEVNTVCADRKTERFSVVLEGGDEVIADRVIDARGLGDPIADSRAQPDNATIKSFPQFMASLDSAFPLEGMNRVAVVGGGDAGKCAVEALLGIGPAHHMSSAKLDFVERIDWYAPGLPKTCEEWRTTQRGRYQRIGGDLKNSDGSTDSSPRLRIYDELGRVSKGFEAAYVNERLYDCVIAAAGWRRQPLDGIFGEYTDSVGRDPSVAVRYGATEAYAIGPAAELPFSDQESVSSVARIRPNRAAIFRLAGRTAALAARLPDTPPF